MQCVSGLTVNYFLVLQSWTKQTGPQAQIYKSSAYSQLVALGP